MKRTDPVVADKVAMLGSTPPKLLNALLIELSIVPVTVEGLQAVIVPEVTVPSNAPGTLLILGGWATDSLTVHIAFSPAALSVTGPEAVAPAADAPMATEARADTPVNASTATATREMSECLTKDVKVPPKRSADPDRYIVPWPGHGLGPTFVSARH